MRDMPSCDKSGLGRWTARDFDGHRLATDIRRRIALPAQISTRQMLVVVGAWRHVDEVPAIGHIGDDEIAAFVRRRLREFLATESNRVFERLVVRLGGEGRSINGTRRHSSGDVHRCDGHQMHRRTHDRMARIRGRATHRERARGAHDLPHEGTCEIAARPSLVGRRGSNHQRGQDHSQR
jgi:hypothetical protein